MLSLATATRVLQRSALSQVRSLAPVLQATARQSASVGFSTNKDAGGHEPKDVTEESPMIAHFRRSSTRHPLDHVKPASSTEPVWDNPVPHAVYDLNKIADVPQTHHTAKKIHERVALFAVKGVRKAFDILSGYRGPGGAMTEKDWLHRCLFLETVAGVPGMVGGMARHLRSLRSMRRDYGWIHTLLEEAENERMHLLIFMNMKQPGPMFRLLVLGAQGVFFNAFFVSYLVSPRTCHRFVGYLEEEAVKTYTGLLKDIEDGHLKEWEVMAAPLISRNYYKLPTDATVYDMIKRGRGEPPRREPHVCGARPSNGCESVRGQATPLIVCIRSRQ